MTEYESRFDPSLPPELTAALLEFDAWAQAQLLVEQGESTPTEPLYHYTGEEALKGILSTGRVVFEFGSGSSKAEQGPLVVPGKRQT